MFFPSYFLLLCQVSNVANGFTSDSIRSIFEPFGTVTECNLPIGGTSAVMVFKDLEPAKNAVEQMDGFELLDQRLKVQWVGAPPSATPAAMPPAPAPVVAAPAVAAPVGTGPSATWKCTLLKNMVSVEETQDDELEGEIIEECSKYGKVEQVLYLYI